MANFAEIDSNGEVIRIIVIDDNDVINNGGNNSIEAVNFVTNLIGLKSVNNRWIQSFKDGSFNQRPAEIGGTYDSNKNVFISKKPYDSWTLDVNNIWKAPIDYPSSQYNSQFVQKIQWDETNQKWLSISLDGENLIWNETTLTWGLI